MERGLEVERHEPAPASGAQSCQAGLVMSDTPLYLI